MVAPKCGRKSKEKHIFLFINNAINYLQRLAVWSLSHMTHGFLYQVLCHLIPKITNREKFCRISQYSGNKIKWIIELITYEIYLKIKFLRQSDFFFFSQNTGEYMTGNSSTISPSYQQSNVKGYIKSSLIKPDSRNNLRIRPIKEKRYLALGLVWTSACTSFRKKD